MTSPRRWGLFVSEGYVTRYDERGRAYRVIPMLERDLKASPEALLDTPITLPTGEQVPFGTFAVLERNTEPRALTRFQQKGSFKLFGGVIPGYTKGAGAQLRGRTRRGNATPQLPTRLHGRVA
jgi:multidrug efflux pump